MVFVNRKDLLATRNTLSQEFMPITNSYTFSIFGNNPFNSSTIDKTSRSTPTMTSPHVKSGSRLIVGVDLEVLSIVEELKGLLPRWKGV